MNNNTLNNNNYELSIWTKFFDNSSKQYIETKQNIIASPSLMFKGKAYNINLKENVNGEKTLTFSMSQKIIDEDGQLILNPFISLLTTEKIIKLRNGEEYSYDENSDLSIIDFYNSLDDENKWSEYVIKTVDEDTSSFVNTYTCKETFINELGKNGWSITLDDELENNYGNLKELGNKSLLGSGWSVSDDSYLPISINTEQLFVLPVNTLTHNNLNINNVLNNSIVKTLKDNDIIYFFYSDVEIGEDEDNNKVWKVKNITTDVFGNPCGPQILYKNGKVFNKQDLDENNIILDYDYNYNFNTEPGAFSGCRVYVVGSIEDTISTTKEIFQGNKIIKKIQSHYEPVAKKYVEDWKINPEHKQFVTSDDVTNVYCYNETEYITSESLLNYIANSSNFISTSGWEIENNNTILNNNDEYLKIRSLEILEPEQIDQNTVAPSNYLNIKSHVNNFKILNELNLGAIDNTLKNKKFVFRWKPRIIRADQNNNIIKEYNNTSLSSSLNNMSEINVCLITKKKDDNNFIVCSNNLDITSNYNINNNDIDNATTPEEKKKAKELRGYPETEINNDYERLTFENLPSGVSVDEQNYVYGYLEINNSTIDFEQYDELYLCMNIGGTINLLYEWNILEIQLFDYKEQFYFDDNNVKINYPIFIYDIPTANIITNKKFYYVKNTLLGKEIVNLPNDVQYYIPIKDDNYYAIKHINLKESNYFNNINSIAELFQVWVNFNISHCKNGKTFYNENQEPIKNIKFSKFPMNDRENFYGFKYKINLNNIKRTIDSSNIVTKLIVKDCENEFATDGICSIKTSLNNISKDNILYNFNYYLDNGLIDGTNLLADLYGLSSTDLGYYYTLKEINTELLEMNQKLNSSLGVIQQIQEKIEANKTAISSCKEELSFQEQTYDSYKNSMSESLKETKLSELTRLRSLLEYYNNLDVLYNNQLYTYNKNLYEVENSQYTNKLSKYVSFWTKDTTYFYGNIVCYETNSYIEKERLQLYMYNSLIYQKNIKPDDVSTDNPWILINQKDLCLIDQISYKKDQKNFVDNLFFKKYSQIIQEGTWNSTDYIDDNEYYFDAQNILLQNSYPKVSYTINVFDRGADFNIGERTYVEDTDFFGYTNVIINDEEIKTPVKVQVIITEMNRVLDDLSKTTITVQTYKNQFEELFSKISSTTTSLSYASGGYNRAANTITPNGEININTLENSFLNNAWILASSKNNLIKWDSVNGITISDLDNYKNILRLCSKGIFLSDNGGNTFYTGITTSEGINTRFLCAGQIDANKINIITNNSYSFRWDKDGVTSFLTETNSLYSYVRYNSYGIYGTQKGNIIDDQLVLTDDFDEKIKIIDKNSVFFLSWRGLSFRSENGNVSFSPINGIEIFNPTLTFNEDFLTNYNNYIYKPDGSLYTQNDLIPLISLGNFSIKTNPEDENLLSYGLRIRDNNGYIVLNTDETGVLWLKNQLKIGQKENINDDLAVIFNTYITRINNSLIFSINSNKIKSGQGNIIINNNKIPFDYDVSSPSNNVNVTFDNNTYTFTITPADFFDDETNNIFIFDDFYNVELLEEKEWSKFIGLQGNTNYNNSNSNAIMLYAGYYVENDSAEEYEKAPFKLYSDGSLIAYNANITGNINATRGNFSGLITVGQNNRNGINGSLNAQYTFWAGKNFSTKEYNDKYFSNVVSGDFLTINCVLELNNSIEKIINTDNFSIQIKNIYYKNSNNEKIFLDDIEILPAQNNFYYIKTNDNYNYTLTITIYKNENIYNILKDYNNFYGDIILINNIPNFYVTSDGLLYAKNAVISGSINVQNSVFSGEINAETGIIQKLYFNQEKTSYIGNLEDINTPSAFLINIENNFLVNDIGDIYGNLIGLVKNNSWANINSSNINSQYNILIGQNNNYIFSIFSPVTDTPQSKIIFGIDNNGNINMSGELKLTNLIFEGLLIGAGNSQQLIIDGEKGSIYSNYWSLNEDGTANFKKINDSGKIISSVFEYNKQSVVGGKILITPVFVFTQDETTTFNEETNLYTCDISHYFSSTEMRSLWNNSNNNITNINIKIIKELTNSFSSEILITESKIIFSEDDNFSAILQFSALEYPQENFDVLPENTQIISIGQNSNFIELSSQNVFGSVIKMNSINNNKVLIGYLDPKDIGTSDYFDIDLFTSENIYGLYADNAFISGRVYLPKAGITNEDTKINIQKWEDDGFFINDIDDDMNIRFWAGTSYNNKSEAPFIVTENGSLFAKDGYFSGTINAKNSYFQGTIYSSNFLLKNSENFVFRINDNENIYDLLTINKDKTIFSNNIFVNSNNFPLFYTILQEKTVVANSFKIFNTSEIVNSFIYGLFFNNNKISFYGIDNVNNTLKNYEDVNTNLFLNDNNYFSIVIDNNNNNNGIFINKDFNIYGENHKIISFSKSTELETNNSIVKVYGNLYFSENIIVKQSKNGLNFIVLKENN